MSQKLYFDGLDSEMCHTLDWHEYDLMNTEYAEEKERILYEAKRLTNEPYFFCKELQAIGEVGSCVGCSFYSPNNGKSGRCKHYGYTYERTGKTKIIKRIEK